MAGCRCGNPPGGGVTCSDDQFSICRVVNGECHGECHDIPSGLTPTQIRSWAYGVLTGSPPSPYRSLAPHETAILNQGWYLNPDTGEIDHFSLPDWLGNAQGYAGATP